MVIFFEKNGILHVMLTYYIKLYKYIHFLLLYLQFCDHSKRILTLNHAVKESTPYTRGLV